MRNAVYVTSAAAACLVLGVATAAPVEVKQGNNRIEVTIGGQPFTAYYFGSDVAKAYLMPLRTASGLIISRPFPVGNDASGGDPKAPSFEPHQRPLYFAHGNIDGLNLWAESTFQKYYEGNSRQPYGKMAEAKIEEIRGGAEGGEVRARFSLQDPNGRAIGEERQEFVFRGDDRKRTIDCEFTVIAIEGPITMGDTKEGTFGIRLGPDLSAPLGQMVNSHGGHGEKEIWGRRADWVNYSGSISDKQVGIVVFEHPSSFRHPTTWHARGYGLLAANPFGVRAFTNDPNQDGSWTIEEGKSLKFRYRVMIYEGSMSPQQIASAYQAYAAQP